MSAARRFKHFIFLIRRHHFLNYLVLNVYHLVWWLILPLILLRLLILSFKNPAYRQNISQRLGDYSSFKTLASALKNGSWCLHGVSVGENIAAASLVNLWLQQPNRPPVVISCMTPTGLAQIKRLYVDKVVAVYLPYDIPRLLKSFFKFFKPRLMVIMETELWPSLIAEASKRRVPLFLVNGRLSERSFVKYSYIKLIMQNWLNCFKLIMVQSHLDYDKFSQLGVSKTRLIMAGNLKFDLTITPSQQQQASSLRSLWPQRKVWIAASLHTGEETMVLEAAKKLWQQYKKLLVVVVPRHLENFQRMKTFFATALGKTRVCCYSELSQHSVSNLKVLIADVMGRLMPLYGASDVVLVGGSLIPHGGHNLLEPAAWQKPIISGVYLNNFIEIRDKLLKANGLTLVKNAEELADAVASFIDNEALAKQQGLNAHKVVMENQGATVEVLNKLKPFM